ncbi:MAG: hypothetical protein V1927_06815 [Candidatus Omnitrophota bacterium]
MTPNPILKVLSTFRKHRVKSLLIGGQACIIYGAAEFSRDSDFAILCENDNLERLKEALNSLKAELIYVPALEVSYLERGHACHFRCKARDVRDLRVDVISKLRGCGPFDKLWERKKTVSIKKVGVINVVGLKDLVQSKKTQRDKDWLMLKRLVENDILLNENNPSAEKIKWWLLESRSSESLVRLGKERPEILRENVSFRPLLSSVVDRNLQKLDSDLRGEELIERQKDIEYWTPLKKELEMLRHNMRL